MAGSETVTIVTLVDPGLGYRRAFIPCDMQSKRHSDKGPSAAAPALAPDSSVEYVLGQATGPDQFCVALAKLFGVRPTEVALLRLEKGLLKFIFPDQLKTAGAMPVSSSSALAAHTATTKNVELFNTFAKVKHARVFESIKLNPTDEGDQAAQPAIQKLMSAPVLDPQRKVLGVTQVCRKGYDLSTAGPDFTLEDLQQLELSSTVLAKAPFMKV